MWISHCRLEPFGPPRNTGTNRCLDAFCKENETDLGSDAAFRATILA